MGARPPKERLDAALVARGLADSRTKAHALVLAGAVYSAGHRLDKPGHPVDSETELELRGPPHPWVSRGGVKLAHGLEHFGLSPAGKVCLDIGASTGGFTDVLLHNGARRIFAVDVGKGQLAWRLRQDERVVVMEGRNARGLTHDDVPDAVEFLVCDASFIGFATVLPAPTALAAANAELIGLIKPQFEVGPERVGKGGVVRDSELHAEVCERAKAWLESQGWQVLGIEESPILGPKGNAEFLIAARRDG